MPSPVSTTVPLMNAIEVFNDNGKTSPRQIQIPIPEPNSNEVRVRIVSSAIDTGTPQIITNDINAYFLHAKMKPMVIGWHYAGIVDKVGSSSSSSSDSDGTTTTALSFKEGDEVFGHLDYKPSTRQGAFSEYITVSVDKVSLKPKGISNDIAAASTTESLTALQAMRDVGGLSSGHRILIIGAGGGVGIAAVQIAKNLGAHVTAVCSTKDVQRVKDFAGADVVVDRKKNPKYMKEYNNKSSSFNVVLDTCVAKSWSKTRKALAPGGTYVTTLPTMGLLRDITLSSITSKRAKFVAVEAKRSDLELVGQWLSNGSLKIEIDSSYKAIDLKNAIERQENKEKIGRVVIDIEGGWEYDSPYKAIDLKNAIESQENKKRIGRVVIDTEGGWEYEV